MRRRPCPPRRQTAGPLVTASTAAPFAAADALRLPDHRLRLCLHGAIRDAGPCTPHIDTSSPNTHPSSQPTPNWMRAVPADQLPHQDRPRAWWGCWSWPVLRWQRSYPPNCARISSWQRAASRRLGCSPGTWVMGRLLELPALCRTADERSSSLPVGAEVLLRERGVLLACGGLPSQGRHPVLTVEAVLDQDRGCCGTRPAPAGAHVVEACQHAGREIHRDLLGPGFLHMRHTTAECGSRPWPQFAGLRALTSGPVGTTTPAACAFPGAASGRRRSRPSPVANGTLWHDVMAAEALGAT